MEILNEIIWFDGAGSTLIVNMKEYWKRRWNSKKTEIRSLA